MQPKHIEKLNQNFTETVNKMAEMLFAATETKELPETCLEECINESYWYETGATIEMFESLIESYTSRIEVPGTNLYQECVDAAIAIVRRKLIEQERPIPVTLCEYDGKFTLPVQVIPTSTGIEIKIAGYGNTNAINPEDHCVILLEHWEGELRVRLWDEMNNQDPKSLSLEKANIKRAE